ncbi:F-box protein CPR1-like [Gossypium hirsutum]|uniref:F-box protein CPR1-like n=1 Tax=Gossypium hirsutum TaxID=3635 RepID=A0ABM3AKL4_GOSHI|nr:F-box protein CPR1-like [Gossypium hirsutum]
MDVAGDVWIMKEYGVKESWVKLMSSTQLDFLPGSPFVVPLAFSKNGNKVLFHKKELGGNWERDSLVWYDLGSKRVEKVGIEDLPLDYDVYLYVESLVPLNDRCPRARDKILGLFSRLELVPKYGPKKLYKPGRKKNYYARAWHDPAYIFE